MAVYGVPRDGMAIRDGWRRSEESARPGSHADADSGPVVAGILGHIQARYARGRRESGWFLALIRWLSASANGLLDPRLVEHQVETVI